MCQTFKSLYSKEYILSNAFMQVVRRLLLLKYAQNVEYGCDNQKTTFRYFFFFFFNFCHIKLTEPRPSFLIYLNLAASSHVLFLLTILKPNQLDFFSFFLKELFCLFFSFFMLGDEWYVVWMWLRSVRTSVILTLTFSTVFLSLQIRKKSASIIHKTWTLVNFSPYSDFTGILAWQNF